MAKRESDPFNRIMTLWDEDAPTFKFTYVRCVRDDPKTDWDIAAHEVERVTFDVRDLPGFPKNLDAESPAGMAMVYGHRKTLEDRTSQSATDSKLADRQLVHDYRVAGHWKDPNPKQRGQATDWLASAIATLQGRTMAAVQVELAAKMKQDKTARKTLALVPAIAQEIQRQKDAGPDTGSLDAFLTPAQDDAE